MSTRRDWTIEAVLDVTQGTVSWDGEQMWELRVGSTTFTYPTLQECADEAIAWALERVARVLEP